MRQPKIIVVGGGLAGLMATIRVAEAGIPVDLFSIVPVKRSHSVCAQGGINAAKNQKGEGDTVDKHFDDTIYGGDFWRDAVSPHGFRGGDDRTATSICAGRASEETRSGRQSQKVRRIDFPVRGD